MVVARWVPSALTRARLLTFFSRQPPRTLGVRSPQYLLIVLAVVAPSIGVVRVGNKVPERGIHRREPP